MPNDLRPIGSSSPVVPGARTTGITNPDNSFLFEVIPQTQVGNSCGTTALAMAMSHVTDSVITQDEVDADIRLTDIYSSASNMRNFARSRGIEGRLVNNLTDREVIENVRKGRPILFLTDLTPEDPQDVATMHWRVIDGYEWVGNRLELHIADPWGMSYWKSWDELQPEWKQIKALGLESGYNRFGVVLGANPADRTLGSDRMNGVSVVENLTDAAADTVNDGVRVSQGQLGRVLNVIVDVLRAAVSLVAYPFQLLFGRVDHSDGKQAQPPPAAAEPAPTVSASPAPSPASPGAIEAAPRPKPEVVSALSNDVRHAAKVVWYDGGFAAAEDRKIYVQAPPSRGTQDALTPPTRHSRTSGRV